MVVTGGTLGELSTTGNPLTRTFGQAGVKAALADVLAPHGLTPAMLKAEGRYAEDVY